MAMTLEAALVFPLTISLIIGIVPAAVRDYREIAGEASRQRQSARLTADPASIYHLAPLAAPGSGSVPGLADAPPGDADVLLASPKLMFSLVTAILDDLKILGLTDS